MRGFKKQQSNALLKILVVGDSGVGKTNLITRYCDNGFKDSYVSTIGIDFKIKKFKYENFSIKLQIWDTAGQQRFRNLTNNLYKGTAGILVAFSITDYTSFQSINTWLRQINNTASQGVNKILIGSKADLQSERKVSKLEAEALAKKNNMRYIQVSSKTGINIQQAFRTLLMEIKQKYDEMDEPIFSSNGVHISNSLDMNKIGHCSC